MKTKLTATCIVIGVLLAPVASFAADDSTGQAKPVTIVKDSVITTKIKTKLAAEKLAYAKNIKVDTDSNGVVKLSGTVATKAEADKAVAIAHDTQGVTSVSNDITVTAAP